MSVFDVYVESSAFFLCNNILDSFLNESCSDGFSLDCPVLSSCLFYDVETSEIAFRDPVISPVDIYDCIAVNTKDLFLSVYSNFNYNSFTVFDDYVYAANENGIFILDSDTDNGEKIVSGIVLPVTTFSSLSDKRIRMCFADCQGVQPTLRLTTYSADRTEVVSDQTISRSKAYFPRTLRGKEWEIRVSDFDSLLLMEFFLTILTR